MTDTPSSDGDAVTVPILDQKLTLYQHTCRYGSCPDRWSRFWKLSEEAADLEAEASKLPIVHRYVYRGDEWRTSSFTINCPHMRSLLSEALDKYQDLDPDLEGWTFTPPYMPLVHRWERLQALHHDIGHEPERKEAADRLVEFLEPRLAPGIDALSTTHSTGKITYDMLWQIFPPGELITTKFFGVDTLCRVLKHNGGTITIQYVDWNGNKCGFQTTKVEIPRFSGVKRVTSLEAFPLSFVDGSDEIKEATIARGRRFQQLRGFHYLSYSGVKISMELEQRPVSGRVVIDAYAYYRSNNKVAPTLRSLSGEDTAEPQIAEPENEHDDHQSNSGDEGDDDNDVEADNETNHMVVVASSALQSRNEDLSDLSDEHCLLTTPWLVGLDMKTKEWGTYDYQYQPSQYPLFSATSMSANTRETRPLPHRQARRDYVERQGL